MHSRFFIAVILVACGSHQQPSSASVAVTHNAYAASTVGDLPACDDTRRGDLFFIEADKTFRVCDATGWAVIDLQGAPGKDGTNGTNGAPGKDATAQSLFATSLHCGGQLASTGLWFSYDAGVLKSGDVLATGSIRNNSAEISKTEFYAATQVGAATAEVLLEYDLLGTANAGYWSIKLDRTTLVTTITNFDADAAGGQNAWTMTPDKCVVNTYP